MSALTSLLVRDRVVPVSKIEEALQHQVLVGGDIETILLEMNALPEDVLSAYRAALYGLLPATREEVMKATREALRRVPRELARGAGFVPLFLEGRTLVVAAAEPPRDELSRQIGTQLACDLAVRIVSQPRLSIALANHYGYELDARHRKLAEALRKREPGVIPYVRPPSPSMKPLTASDAPPNPFGAAPPDTLDHQGLPSDDDSDPAGFKLSEPALVDDYTPPPAKVMETDEVHGLIGAAAREPSGVWPGEALPRDKPRSSSTIPPATVSAHIARAVRGPISRERVITLLAEAYQRDDVLFVLLRYTQQFFDFVAVLSVGKEGARGRMAHGARLAPELMEQVVLPLTGAGLAAVATRDKRPVVGDLSHSDDERAAAALLGRPAGRPGVMVPMVLGSRTVLLVYGEREGEGVSLEDAEPLTAIAKAVADALRRLIVENKALKRPPSGPPAGGGGESAPTPSEPPASVSPAAQPSAPPAVDTADSAASQLTSAVARVVEADPPPPDVRLQAVDLESMTRPGNREQRRRETMPLHSAVALADEPQHNEARETARARVFGVPRSAPPPPMRESLAPPKNSGAGSYSFVSPAGSRREEKVRTSRSAIQSRPPLGLVEAPSSPEPEASEKPADSRAAEPRKDALPDPSTTAEAQPTRRASRASMEAVGPSVIIDMGDQVALLVDTLKQAEPHQEPAEISELLKVGEVALPVLMQHFPGPLWFERENLHKRRPRGRDVSAIARAIVAFGESAAPYLASVLGSSDENAFYALMVAGEIVHPDLLDAVARHALGFDDELRAVALEVLRAYTALPQFPTVLRAIADLSARAGKDPRRQRLAVEALGELRDPRALEALLPRLSDKSEPVVQAAHRALVTLTGQDFGLAQKKWESWAEQWSSAHRVEWLIESLAHADESVRVLAGEELKQLTQQYFGYHPSLPRKDRELAQRKYREWWQREGREAFGVSS
jgi:HEAT repeat protein